MNAVLTKEKVAKAIADLIANDKKPTLAAVHAALGNRGSTSTLIRLKAEIDAAATTVPDSDEGLKTFREVWALAMDEGRKANQALVNELVANIQVVCQQNEKLEGEAVGLENRIGSLEKEKSLLEIGLAKEKTELENQLNRAQAALVEANGRASQAFEQLSQAQTGHAAELTALRADLDQAVERLHATELELAACKARLEANR
jgi:chromosome segregation ATPase